MVLDIFKRVNFLGCGHSGDCVGPGCSNEKNPQVLFHVCVKLKYNRLCHNRMDNSISKKTYILCTQSIINNADVHVHDDSLCTVTKKSGIFDTFSTSIFAQYDFH